MRYTMRSGHCKMIGWLTILPLIFSIIHSGTPFAKGGTMTDDPKNLSSAPEPRLIPAVSSAAKDLTAAITEEARGIADLASEQATTLKDKVADSGAEVRDWAKEGVEGAKRAAKREGQAIRSDVHRRLNRAHERIESIGEAAANSIRENPFESVLIGIGFGFVVGWAARR